MTKNKFLVVVNPNSGAGKAGKDWEKIKTKLTNAGFDFDVAISQAHRHSITQVKEAIEKGIRHIIVVGGDGTLHHVANGIMLQKTVSSSDIKIGMISIGTGNDWIRHFEVPKSYDEAIQIIKNGKTAIQDLGKISYTEKNETLEEYFMNFAGLGFDAFVVERTAHLKKYGQAAYLMGLLQNVIKYKGQKLKVEVDGKVVAEDDMFMVIAGIGKYGGGGMMICPNADINDGLFDVNIIRSLSLMEVAMEVANLFNGKYIKHKKVSSVRGKQVKVTVLENQEGVKTEADGELFGTGPFQMDIIENAMQVFVP